MQNKLAIWSNDNRARRFNRLLRLIADRTWLQEAARIALASRGAKTPGVDGVNGKAFQQQLDQHLDLIHNQL